MLKLEDHLAIVEAYARYNRAVDSGDIDAWVNAYAEDGILIAPDRNIEGRTSLETFAKERITARRARPTRNQQHWISNLIVEGDAAVARATCYVVVMEQRIDDGVIVMRNLGHWHDDLRKVDGQWLFTHRVNTRDDLLEPE